MNLDTKIASGVAAVYFALCAVLLPMEEYLRAFGGGALVFGVIAAVAHRMGRGPFPGMSILAVAFASAIILVFPTFPAMGGTNRVAIPLGFLGVQAAVLLWASLRWAPPESAASRTSLDQAWLAGCLGALGLSAIASIPMAILVISRDPRVLRLLWVYPAYFIGLMSAATLYWLLQRLSHLATGRYLMGFLGGVCVYGAVAPVVALVEEEPLSAGTMLVIALIAGGLVGPAVALDTTERGIGR